MGPRVDGQASNSTLQQVTPPSAFSISDTSSATTRSPVASSRARVRGAEAEIALLRGNLERGAER